MSKAVVYGLALEDYRPDEVLRKIGVEPSGEAFNSITFDEKNKRPFNPMPNADVTPRSASRWAPASPNGCAAPLLWPARTIHIREGADNEKVDGTFARLS